MLQRIPHITDYRKSYKITSLPQRVQIHFSNLHLSFFQCGKTQIGIQRECMRLILILRIQHINGQHKRFQRNRRFIIRLITGTINTYPGISSVFQRRQIKLHFYVWLILAAGNVIDVLIRIHQTFIVGTIHKCYLARRSLFFHLK